MNDKVFTKETKHIDPDKLKYLFYVFDTETTCLEPMAKNFVFGVVFGYKYKRVIYSVEDFQEEFKKRRYENKFVFAHNAEFDLMTIYGNIYINLDHSAIFNGGFIQAKKDKVIFADSMNLFSRMSVAKIGSMINLDKMINTKVKTEGLTKENITEEDILYCETDCKIIWIALRRLFESVGNIKTTLPSLALFDFRKNYLKNDIYIDSKVYDFYDSYYGGRCEAFKIGSVNAKVYDINSMYPYAMKNTIFPDPSHLKKIEKPGIKGLMKFLRLYEGLAKVKVFHKDHFFGFLPVKIKIDNSEKLIFPVGTFETIVNFNELRFAIDSGIVDILDCEYLIYGNRVKSPFIDYVNDLYDKKETAKDILSRTMYKLRLNALYGKFGQKTKYITTYYEDFPLNEVKKLKEENKYFQVKPFNLKRKDCFLITENDKPEHGFFSIPVFASYITSEARVLLLSNLLLNLNNNPVYCDTDSIFLEGEFFGSLGNELGEFKKEEKRIIEVLGLKNYVYENTEGQIFRVLKGVSKFAKKEEITEELETGIKKPEVYNVKKYYKTLQALRQNKQAGQSFTMIKVIKRKYNKRRIDITGKTKPLILPLKIDNTMKNKEPESFYEAVLMFFVRGGKVKKSEIINHITGNSPKTLRLYKWLYSENAGISFDTFNERVPDHLAVSYPIEEVTYILTKFYRISDMKKELKRINYKNVYSGDYDNMEIFPDETIKTPF